MADYNEDHAAKLKHLYKVAVKQNEKAKALTQRVADLEAAGGQANKIESIKVNGTAQAIGADKSVNITVPTKTSQLNNDSGYRCQGGGGGRPPEAQGGGICSSNQHERCGCGAVHLHGAQGHRQGCG